MLTSLKELGLGLVPFAPLSRDILAGDLKQNTVLDKSNFRAAIPRFKGENFQNNMELAEFVQGIAKEKALRQLKLPLPGFSPRRPGAPTPGTTKVSRRKRM